MSTDFIDLAAIYREAKDRQDEAPKGPGGRALVRQYDEIVAVAVEDLERALERGDLEAARAVQRGLRALSDAFGGAEWVTNP